MQVNHFLQEKGFVQEKGPEHPFDFTLKKTSGLYKGFPRFRGRVQKKVPECSSNIIGIPYMEVEAEAEAEYLS